MEVLQAEAYAHLATTPTVGSTAAIAAATAALRRNLTNRTALALRAEVVALTAALNASVGLDVLGNQDPGLNVETMDQPLSDAAFLLQAFKRIGALKSEPASDLPHAAAAPPTAPPARSTSRF